jgi:hypothetical protein
MRWSFFSTIRLYHASEGVYEVVQQSGVSRFKTLLGTVTNSSIYPLRLNHDSSRIILFTAATWSYGRRKPNLKHRISTTLETTSHKNEHTCCWALLKQRGSSSAPLTEPKWDQTAPHPGYFVCSLSAWFHNDRVEEVRASPRLSSKEMETSDKWWVWLLNLDRSVRPCVYQIPTIKVSRPDVDRLAAVWLREFLLLLAAAMRGSPLPYITGQALCAELLTETVEASKFAAHGNLRLHFFLSGKLA